MGQLSGSQTAKGTSTAILADQRVIDMADTIALLEPDAAPLTVFTKQMKSGRECFNPEFSWLEDVLAPKVITADTAGYADSATTLNVVAADGPKVASYDLLKNPATGEIMLVTAVATAALTIVRAFGTTAAAAIAASQVLLVIGNANAENQAVRDIKATSTTKKTNYAQIFRTPFGFSRTLRDSKTYGGNYKAYQSRKKGIEHRVEIERQFLFGEPKEQVNTDSGRWATGGLDYFISTNRIDANQGISYSGLLDAAQTVFRYGNQKMRLCLAAPTVISKIDLLAEARLFHQTNTTAYGVSISKIQTSHGDLMLVKHPLLQETAAYNERMFILDMDKISERPFVGANTKLKTNIQTPSVDGEVHEYLTQIGLQVENETCHAVLYNAA
jgi:hypothetical protein